MIKKKIIFIVNPVSGTGKQKKIEIAIQKGIDLKHFSYEIFYTTHKGHATEIATKVNNGSAMIVAVGGDGTINEIAKTLIGKNIPLGIVPAGSGNGFARHFGIPTNINKALGIINHFNVIASDSAKLNDKIFISTAGCGFDAHIAGLFSHSVKRGFSTYVKLVLKEFMRYKPLEYKIIIDHEEYSRKAFLLTVANCSQFGNNAFISPMANAEDGILNITLIKPFPLSAVPGLIYSLFTKKIHQSKYVETLKGKEIFIQQSLEMAHLDGEAINPGKEISISILPKSLNLIVP